jgi:hypothetical protein
MHSVEEGCGDSLPSTAWYKIDMMAVGRREQRPTKAIEAKMLGPCRPFEPMPGFECMDGTGWLVLLSALGIS